MFVQELQELNNMKVSYDKTHDVLYLYFGDPTISYDDEMAPGIILRLSDESDSVTGVIIIDYKKRNYKDVEQVIPININFNAVNRFIH